MIEYLDHPITADDDLQIDHIIASSREDHFHLNLFFILGRVYQ
jgi:hypothetical protein